MAQQQFLCYANPSSGERFFFLCRSSVRWPRHRPVSYLIAEFLSFVFYRQTTVTTVILIHELCKIVYRVQSSFFIIFVDEIVDERKKKKKKNGKNKNFRPGFWYGKSCKLRCVFYLELLQGGKTVGVTSGWFVEDIHVAFLQKKVGQLIIEEMARCTAAELVEPSRKKATAICSFCSSSVAIFCFSLFHSIWLIM